MINIRNYACFLAMNWLASRTICSAYKIRSFTPGATCRTVHSSSMKTRNSQSDVDGTMDAPSGMDSLSKSYDSFIIDQWGVLHDGKKPYPGVTECLQKLKDDGKNLILLSNSSKRKANSVKGLDKVGIKSSLFDEIVTSGEIAWNAIIDRDFQFKSSIFPEDDYVIPSKFKEQETLKVFVIGNNDDDLEYISSCGCVLAPPETADFILARGTFCVMSGTGEAEDSYETMTFSGSPGMSSLFSELAQVCEGGTVAFTDAEDLMAAIDPYLERCIARNLPMLVSNPDYHRPGSGAPMPGLIGELCTVLQCISQPLLMKYCYMHYTYMQALIVMITNNQNDIA